MTQALKPTTRLTLSQVRYSGRGRQIAVTIHPTWLSFRLKGTRKAFLLDVEAAYQFAAKLEANRARIERAKEKAESKRKADRGTSE